MTIAIPRSQFSDLQVLSDLANTNAECFAQGSRDICSVALDASKFLFDLGMTLPPLHLSVAMIHLSIAVSSEKYSKHHINQLIDSLDPSYAPQTRSQSLSKGKRKRTPSPPPLKSVIDSTPIDNLFVEGMNDEQVWTQLDLRTKHICKTLEHVLKGDPDEEESMEDGSSDDEYDDDEDLNKMLKAMANGEVIDFDAPEDADNSSSDEDVTGSSEGESDEGDEEDSEHEDGLPESVTDLHDPSSDENDTGTDFSSPPSKRKSRGSRSGKHPELDDTFFDLASFNAETEKAEAKSSSRGRLSEEGDSDDDASVDLFAALEGEEDLNDNGESPGGKSVTSIINHFKTSVLRGYV